jgi:hypothetical protein
MIGLNCVLCNDFFLLAQRDFISDSGIDIERCASGEDVKSGDAPLKFLKFLASALQLRHSPASKMTHKTRTRAKFL